MSSIGPSLPPHLTAKRKREDDDAKEPSLDSDRSRSSSHESVGKRQRVVGPSLPPAALDERPSTDSTEEQDTGNESDSNDDFGPAPPPVAGSVSYEAERQRKKDFEASIAAQEATKKPQRDEWMLAPPSQGDWSSRVDPTKLKNRKFKTGKGAKAPAQEGSKDNTLWTETPEQKRQRLEDEVMGVKKPAQLDQGTQRSTRSQAEEAATDRRIKEYNEKNRNASLYAEHKKTNPQEKEDDPSKRAFDKEKDIGGGMKISYSKRKELLNKAADFGSRFSKGSYL